MSEQINLDDLNQLLLISGQSTAGKSMSLRNIRNQEKWIYLGTEAGKRLPFKNKFNSIRITDPYHVLDYMDDAIAAQDKVEGVILDTFTFWMDMMESMYVVGSANTQAAWGQYGQLPKTLLQQKVATFGKPVIILAHAKESVDKHMNKIVCVPIKGSMQNNGVEAYFSTVVMAKRMEIELLENFQSDILKITDRERAIGVKHVFQTMQTKETIGERIRSPYEMFADNQVYMDNDAQMLLDHMNAYYA